MVDEAETRDTSVGTRRAGYEHCSGKVESRMMTTKIKTE